MSAIMKRLTPAEKIQDDYEAKLVSADEAVKVVKSGIKFTWASFAAWQLI